MRGHQFLGCFQLEKNNVFDDQICAEITYLLTVIEDWHCDFGFYFEA